MRRFEEYFGSFDASPSDTPRFLGFHKSQYIGSTYSTLYFVTQAVNKLPLTSEEWEQGGASFTPEQQILAFL
jgi:hypothetical protein